MKFNGCTEWSASTLLYGRRGPLAKEVRHSESSCPVVPHVTSTQEKMEIKVMLTKFTCKYIKLKIIKTQMLTECFKDLFFFFGHTCLRSRVEGLRLLLVFTFT